MHLGTDDSGRCLCVGSLVLAGVSVRDFSELDGIDGIRDSKLTNREQREKVMRKVMARKVRFATHFIPPGMMTKNINLLEAEGTEAVLRSLGYQPGDWVYVDNCERTVEKFRWRWSQLDTEIQIDGNWRVEHHADKRHKIVSLASIIAKHYSDMELDCIRVAYPDIGSGVANNPQTIDFLRRNLDNPPSCIRQSWITFKRLKEGRDGIAERN